MRKVVLKILLSAMIALMAVDALSQTQTENYVMTIESLTESTQAPKSSIDMSRVTVRYLDGLGREKSDPEGYRNRSNMKIEIYKNEEEKRVITNGDTSAATKLGESLRRIYGQTIRIPIADPTTTNVNEQEYLEKLNLLNNGIENSNGK